MKISILQMPVAFARPDENIQTLRRMVEASMREEPDVLVLPELWRLGFYPQPIAVHADLDGQQSRAVLAELARKNGVNIVGGTVANRREGRSTTRATSSTARARKSPHTTRRTSSRRAASARTSRRAKRW